MKAGDRIKFNRSEWDVLEVLNGRWLKLRCVDHGFTLQWMDATDARMGR